VVDIWERILFLVRDDFEVCKEKPTQSKEWGVWLSGFLCIVQQLESADKPFTREQQHMPKMMGEAMLKG